MENLTKKQEKEVKKEVSKRLRDRILSRTKKSASKFKDEFKRHTVTAITAAFAFLIALSWRVPIQGSIDKVKEKLGLVGTEVYIEYFSAVLITLIAVLALIFFSRWTSKE